MSTDDLPSIGPEALAYPLEFPDEFKDWLADYVAKEVPKLPISQVFGYQLQRVRSAETSASETRAATAYGDLTTVGPTLTGMANGFYLLVFGADTAQSTSAGRPFMAPSINGATPTDADAATWTGTYPSPARTTSLRILMVQLNVEGGNNTITMKYRSTSGTSTFQFRFLHAIKVLTLDE